VPDISITQPFSAYSAVVRAEWLDYNNHMNDSAYAVVCTEANEILLDDLGLGAEYRQATGSGMYTVEAHIRFVKEVGSKDSLRAETLVVDADSKRLRVHTTILVQDGSDVCTGEYMYLHVNQGTGRVTPFPADRYSAVNAIYVAHQHIDRPRHLGRGISFSR
jgi:acyl-CoA thioesterase FadM